MITAAPTPASDAHNGYSGGRGIGTGGGIGARSLVSDGTGGGVTAVSTNHRGLQPAMGSEARMQSRG